MFCIKCGKFLAEGLNYCQFCGAEQNKIQPDFSDSDFSNLRSNSFSRTFDSSVSSKSRGIAAILAFCIGFLGAHRFYTGKIKTGILMALLTICSFVSAFLLFIAVYKDFASSFLFLLGFLFFGLASVVWNFVDFIVILCGIFKDKDGKILKNWNFD